MNRRWTREEEEYLEELYNQKIKIKDIAILINQKFNENFESASVKRKISNMGISKKKVNNPHNTQTLQAKKASRIGQTKMSNDGALMKIIEYNGANDMLVQFQDKMGYIVHASYKSFSLGTVKNPGKQFMYNRGYIGQGEYLTTYRLNGKKQSTKAYDAWKRMFDRCYSDDIYNKYPTYKGVTVCEEWWNFQIFAKWFYSNYYEAGMHSMEVDKDWLVIGNKLYCPENCCIAPNMINSCLSTHDKIKNFDLPMGISPTASGKYQARCSAYGKRKDLGTYLNVADAEHAYWTFKINYIEELANEYKYCIPGRLYEVMINFKYTYKQRYGIEEGD